MMEVSGRRARFRASRVQVPGTSDVPRVALPSDEAAPLPGGAPIHVSNASASAAFLATFVPSGETTPLPDLGGWVSGAGAVHRASQRRWRGFVGLSESGQPLELLLAPMWLPPAGAAAAAAAHFPKPSRRTRPGGGSWGGAEGPLGRAGLLVAGAAGALLQLPSLALESLGGIEGLRLQVDHQGPGGGQKRSAHRQHLPPVPPRTTTAGDADASPVRPWPRAARGRPETGHSTQSRGVSPGGSTEDRFVVRADQVHGSAAPAPATGGSQAAGAAGEGGRQPQGASTPGPWPPHLTQQLSAAMREGVKKAATCHPMFMGHVFVVCRPREAGGAAGSPPPAPSPRPGGRDLLHDFLGAANPRQVFADEGPSTRGRKPGRRHLAIGELLASLPPAPGRRGRRSGAGGERAAPGGEDEKGAGMRWPKESCFFFSRKAAARVLRRFAERVVVNPVMLEAAYSLCKLQGANGKLPAFRFVPDGGQLRAARWLLLRQKGLKAAREFSGVPVFTAPNLSIALATNHGIRWCHVTAPPVLHAGAICPSVDTDVRKFWAMVLK